MSLVKIEVVSSEVKERKGEKKDKSGSYHLRLQEGYLHNGHAYPERFELNLGADRPAYAPGFYSLAPASIEAKNGRLGFAYELVLLRLDAEPAKPAKAADAAAR